jgi:RNA polymerase sigma factor (sigma-70 family)
MNYSDNYILSALKKGDDEKVLPFLYKKVLPKVRYYINRNKGNDEEAKDIFQDAVIIFYKKAKMNELPEGTNITSFICFVSKNLWINRVKKINRTVEMVEDGGYMEEENFIENIFTEEKKTALTNLLAEVGEECRKLLKYSIYDNLSMKEICSLMGYSSENVAKTYNYRCKQKLIQLVMKNKDTIKLLKE